MPVLCSVWQRFVRFTAFVTSSLCRQWDEALAWKMPVLHLQGKIGEKERLIPDAFLGGRARGANAQLLQFLPFPWQLLHKRKGAGEAGRGDDLSLASSFLLEIQRSK